MCNQKLAHRVRIRGLWASVSDGRRQAACGAPGARRRKAASCTFFRFVARLRGDSTPFGVVRRLRRRTFYKPVRFHSSDLRFCSMGMEAGRLGRARLCNKLKKMCTKRRIRRQTRNKPQKMCSRRPASTPGRRARAPAGGDDAPARDLRAPAGQAESQPAASRAKPAPIAEGRPRPQPAHPPLARHSPNPHAPAICGGFVRRTRRSQNHKQQGRWTYMSIGP